MRETWEKTVAYLYCLAEKLPRPSRRTAASLLLALLTLVGGLSMFLSLRRTALPEVEQGTCRVADPTEKTRKGSPSKLVVTDGLAGVFFEKSGYFLLCTLGGDLRFAVQVDTAGKGTGNMACLDGFWILETRNHRFFRFNNRGELQESFSGEEESNAQRAEELRQRMGETRTRQVQTEGRSFRLGSGSGPLILEAVGGTERVVYELPEIGGGVLISALLLTFCPLILLGMALLGRKREEKR